MARWFRCLALLFSVGALPACGAGETVIDVENEPAPLWQGTVDDAVASSCSTGVVLGLSNQIVDQVNCLRPNTLAELPARPNLTRAANTFAFMQPPARDALLRALDANTGMTLGINSMLRTVAQQYLLYAWYMAGRCSIMLAARPGGSNHESGLALDTSQYAAWQTALEAQGFVWFGSSDVVHFDFTGPGTIDLRPVGVRGFQRLWNINHPADMIAEDGIYGPNTESRLRQSPANGFAMPAPCGAPPDGGTGEGGAVDARAPDADAGTTPDSTVSDARPDAPASDTSSDRTSDAGGSADRMGSLDSPATDVPVTTDAGTGGTGGTSMSDAPVRPDVPPTPEPDAASSDASNLPPGALDAGCSCRMVAPPPSSSSAIRWAALGFIGFAVQRRRARAGKRFARIRTGWVNGRANDIAPANANALTPRALFVFGSAIAMAAMAELGCSQDDGAPSSDSGGATTLDGAGGGGAGAGGSRIDASIDAGGASGASQDGGATDATRGTDGRDDPTPDAAAPDADARLDSAPQDGAPADVTREDAVGADIADVDASQPPPPGRGATLPYWEYQAEDGDTNGTRIGPSRVFGDPAAEASHRRAVRLDATGQYVRITSNAAANSIVVRYSVPDKGEGADSFSTLGVYVNGAMRAKLSVTSRWSWTYGDFGNPNPNDPLQGKPHHFYDEARALIGDVPAGAVVSVQKDADDVAGYYIIDLIDLEQVAAPLPQPPNSIAIGECGATADDTSDDGPAIQQCIDRARTQGRALYIPKGTFRSLTRALSVDNVTIRGAGMWHSIISGFHARFDCYGNGCKYYDFAVLGDTVLRDDMSPETAFSGVTGDGTVLENIWAEHSKVGYWVGPGASNLVIRASRFRNMYADGINLWKGTSNSLVEHCHFRNTGDDAMASWSPSDGAPSAGNVLRFNTVQVPWMANCIGLYGGTAHRVEDNVCEDVVQYPGILLARQFGSLPFAGTTQILRNSLLRAGGPAYGEEQGAIKFHAAEGVLSGIVVQDLTIQDATFSGIHLQGGHRIENLRFQNVTVNAPGTSGIRINHDANGVGVANGLVVSRGGMDDQSRGVFSWTREAGNSGW